MEGIGKYGGGNRDSHLKEYGKYRIIQGPLNEKTEHHLCPLPSI
jgi:hypothetical protein